MEVDQENEKQGNKEQEKQGQKRKTTYDKQKEKKSRRIERQKQSSFELTEEGLEEAKYRQFLAGNRKENEGKEKQSKTKEKNSQSKGSQGEQTEEESETEGGFVMYKTKNMKRKDQQVLSQRNESTAARQSTQTVRQKYTFALRTSRIHKDLLSPVAFTEFLKKELGPDGQPDHAQSIGQGTAWLLSFTERDKMAHCLAISKKWERVTLEVGVDKENEIFPLVVARVGSCVTAEDFLSIEGVTKAAPLRNKYGMYVNKWKIAYHSRETRDTALKDGVAIGFFHFETEAYVPAQRVLQCFRCLGFGHSQTSCNATAETCYKCAKKHSGKECEVSDPRLFKCLLCRGNHHARSWNCPERQKAYDKVQPRPYNETVNMRHQGVTKPPPAPPAQTTVTTTFAPSFVPPVLQQRHERPQSGPSSETALPSSSQWGGERQRISETTQKQTISNGKNTERAREVATSVFDSAKRIFDTFLIYMTSPQWVSEGFSGFLKQELPSLLMLGQKLLTMSTSFFGQHAE